MRITQRTVVQDALRGLFGNLDALHQAQDEVTTGRRIRRVSDQPLEAGVVMKLDSQLRGLERYRRSVIAVNTRLSTEDAVLTSVETLLRQVKDSAATTGSATDDSLRAAAVTEIRLIRDQIIDLGNTQVSGDYIFGGGLRERSPFRDDGTYVGGSTIQQMEIGDGMRVATNQPGDEVLSDVLNSLDLLARDLESGTPDSIQDSLAKVHDALSEIQGAQAEVGSRMRQVAEVEQFLIRETSTLTDHKQALQDADPTESLLKLAEAKNALDRAYAAIGKVLSTDLLQYLS
jgi:flagellar hook-associated protein 3 FlgL